MTLNLAFFENAGIARNNEPITFGLPFPKGKVSPHSKFRITDNDGQPVPTATMPIALWADGSIKWLLFDLQLSMEDREEKCLAIENFMPGKEAQGTGNEDTGILKLDEDEGKVFIRTGEIAFELDSQILLPFSQIILNGQPCLLKNTSRILLIDENEKERTPRIDFWKIEIQNPLRMVLAFEGKFIPEDNAHCLRYLCRIHFFSNKATARIDFTIWNPGAAHHPGGVWDLGDAGSIFFKDLSFKFTLNSKKTPVSHWKTHPTNPINSINPIKPTDPTNIVIYQDSSGGKNWRSRNHVNRNEKIPLNFKGFEVRNGRDIISQGLRATPSVAVSKEDRFFAASIKKFWQNFPKAIESNNGTLMIRLFPKYFNDLFELQGGEQKTHTFYICADQEPVQDSFLDWVHEPLIPKVPSEWYHSSGACPRPVPIDSVDTDSYYIDYQRMVDIAIRGERSFFDRREIIDEYGWRNFGDIYADHESVLHNGPEELVSHYNNQYDVIKGGIIQYMRTSEPLWFQLADEYASHVSDIDIYHTEEDRYQYNHGMFWHTDHHVDAATSNHRSASRNHREFKDPRFVGSGPALAHLYTTGLLYHYWLTGEKSSMDSLIALSDYVIRCLNGPDTLVEISAMSLKSVLKLIREKIRPEASAQGEYFSLKGPGRASGNALNALLDGYLMSADDKYLNYAELLIRNCVSPEDDLKTMNLLDAETRWMYTIFLQSLGKYIDVKKESGHFDTYYWYAKTAFLKYASWMLENEYPYLDKPEILEFPNETWAAQDIRKSDILAHAAFYSPDPLSQRLLEKSRFFFEECINRLNDFENRELTRPVAILMTNGMVHMEMFSEFNRKEEEISLVDINYSLQETDLKLQKNSMWDQFCRLIEIVQQLSFKKELRWIKQRLNSRM